MGIRLDIYNDMAKAEEIKILDKLTKCFVENPDNYLASLFTAEFLGWATNQIRDDIMVDVMQHINDYSKDDEIRELKQELDSQKKVTELNAEETDKLEREIREGEDFICTDLKPQIQILESEKHELMAEASTKLDDIHNLEQENTRLKAKLYDLEHPDK